MPAFDFELDDIYQILSTHGISKDRCLLNIKKGWIDLRVDNISVMEFNRKKVMTFNDKGQAVDIVEYKWKDGGVTKKSQSWNEVKTFFMKQIKLS